MSTNTGPFVHNGKPHLPIPKGRYVVGCTDVMVGPSVADGSFFRLFYPTDISTDKIFDHCEQWPKWIAHPKYIEGFTEVDWLKNLPFIGQKMVGWAFGGVYIPVVFDAQPKNDQIFPVIIYSHGVKACRTTYSTICTELASQGFIVAATEHRDKSACMSLNLVKSNSSSGYKEDWIHFNPEPFERNDLPLRKQQLSARVHDCQRTLDVLMQISDGRTIEHLILSSIDLLQFKGSMDCNKPVVAGHSFGGATVFRTLAVDKRFRIGIALDPWMWPLRDEVQLPEEIEQPILFINMEAFQTVESLKTMKPFTLAVQVERRCLMLKGSQHLNQVDLPLFLPAYLRLFAGANSAIEPFLAMDLNNRLCLQFIRKHLGQVESKEDSIFLEKHENLIKTCID